MASAGRKPAFVCPGCGCAFGDPLYHGPRGHAPPGLCFDCWADEWAHIEVRMRNGGDWTVLDSATWLVCCGLSRQEAAQVLGLHRNTICKWVTRLRKDTRLVPDWLTHRIEAARLRR